MALIVLAFGTGVWANDDVTLRGNEESLSVSIADMPLRRVLEALARRGFVEVMATPALDERVDLHADATSLQVLLHRLLRRYSYIHLEKPGIDQLWVLPEAGTTSSVAWRAGAEVELARLRLDLTDPDPAVREDAVLALSDLSPGITIDLVVPAISDPVEAVREAAEAVLEDIGATDYVDVDRLME